MNAKKLHLKALRRAEEPAINYTVRPRSDFDPVDLGLTLGWLNRRYSETRELKVLWRSHACWSWSGLETPELHESEEEARAACQNLLSNREYAVTPLRVWHERIDL